MSSILQKSDADLLFAIGTDVVGDDIRFDRFASADELVDVVSGPVAHVVARVWIDEDGEVVPSWAADAVGEGIATVEALEVEYLEDGTTLEQVTPLKSDRVWASAELRRMADDIDRGELHAVAAYGVYTADVAATEDRSTATFQWVAGDVFNSRVLRLALAGLMHETSLRTADVVQWSDLELET